MTKKWTLYFFFIFFSKVVLAQTNYTKTDIHDSLFQDNNSVSIQFYVDSKEQIDTLLTHILSVDYFNVKTNQVIAYANKEQFLQFTALNIPYSLILPNSSRAITMATTVAQMQNWDRYPTYSVYEQMMTGYQTSYSNLFKKYELLTLSSGRKIIAGKLTSNVNQKASKPKFIWSSTIHGDETTGFVILLRYIDYLLSNYETNQRVKEIVDSIELWILPNTNPDGTYYNSSSGTTIVNARRENANGVDMNRNYRDPRAGAHPDGNSYQPETQTMMNLADTLNFVMGANFHGGAEVVNFPWDTWASASRKHADDDWWRLVSNEFADTCQVLGPKYSLSGYFTDTYSSGITEGGDWYVITGGRQDYMNYFKHCREVTLEISSTKMGESESLNNYWNSLYRSMMNYTEQCLNGIKGVVSDSCTGKPIQAKIFVNSHDKDSSWVYSSIPFGNYYRPIKAGTWSLTYSATGYQSKTISNISVSDGNAVIRNIKLMPNTPITPTANYTYTQNLGNITCTNTSTNGITYLWSFGDGNTSTDINPSHSFATTGKYNVQLTTTNGCGLSNTVTKEINITSVGFNEINKTAIVRIYPNPLSTELFVNIFSNNKTDAQIRVMDILGNTIKQFSKNLIEGENVLEIDLSNVSTGIYFLKVETSSYQYFNKVIKNK
ncbi:MAG TPA: M14 family zinc carboxypeptidase [Bacteroidales bacterium]|nr:M14 family zinc carboxypeptidase [Bacteroidales bacterium]